MARTDRPGTDEAEGRRDDELDTGPSTAVRVVALLIVASFVLATVLAALA